MTYTTDTRGSELSFGQRIADIRSKLADRLTKARVYRTTVAELNNLSDRELNDLGIARSSIKRLAIEAAYGK